MAQPKRKEPKLSSVTPVRMAAEPEEASRWSAPKKLGRTGWAVIAAVVLLFNLPLIHHALRSAPAANVSLPYADDFSSRETIASHYSSTGGLWRVVNGQLFSPGVRNNPLWLKAKLPRDVSIEFDVRCESPEADVRVEVFGNGVDHLSGYELVHGGWNNQLSALIRLNGENGPSYAQVQTARRRAGELGGSVFARIGELFGRSTAEPKSYRVEAPGNPVRQGKSYHWKIERRGSVIRWEIDGQLVIPPFEDPAPLVGPGHDRFGFSSVESDIYYDNLKVYPVDGSAPFTTAAPRPPPAQPGAFSDDFARTQLGDNWLATDSSAVRIADGSVTVQGAHNHPVWLTRPIPANASIELDCWSDSPDGDIKVEAWGDGVSFYAGPPMGQYTATGYVFIFAGWGNQTSVIARQNEHAPDRIARSDVRAQPGRKYHWRITRRDGRIDWSIDGQPFLTMNDRAPLQGPSHQYFAFSGWETRVHFANLKIQPL